MIVQEGIMNYMLAKQRKDDVTINGADEMEGYIYNSQN